MRTLIRFIVACLAITAVVSFAKRRTKRGDRPEVVVVQRAPQPPEAPMLAEAPLRPFEVPLGGEVPLHPPRRAGEVVRIVTSNGAAFLSLRGEHVVGGLSDSVRALAQREINREMREDSASSRVGRAIANVVVDGVKNLLSKELSVPLRDVEDVQFVNGRIEFSYRPASKRHITFDDFKNDGTEFLAQFKEDEARRFVVIVREKLGKP